MYDPGTLYEDPILSGFSVGYSDQRLFGERIFPVTRVRTQSGRYRVFDRSDWLIFPSRREPGTVANEVRGRKWSSDTFKTQEHSLQTPILDEERQELTSLGGLANDNVGGALTINPEVDGTKLITRSLLLEHELKVATATRNTANYPAGHTVTLAGTSRWDDQTTAAGGATEWWQVVSNPVADIRAGVAKIKAKIGRGPNLLVLPNTVPAFLESHPRIVSRYMNFSLLNPDAFRILTGFEGEILLTDSQYNSADNVDATEALASFWGTDVWLGYVDPSDNISTPTWGKTFSQVYPNGDIRPTDRWREEPRKADVIRTSYKYDYKIVSSIAGYLIKTVIS